MEGMSRHSWLHTTRSLGVALGALIVLLAVGGYLLTSTTIRRDRDEAAERHAEVEAVQAQGVLGRARAYVAGLAEVLASEPKPSQARFARWAVATSASVGLNDVLWVERVPASERRRYERRRGVSITRLTASGEFVRAPRADSYLPATFTSGTRPELRRGVDVSAFSGLGAAIRDRATIFAVGASKPAALGREPGFYLLEAATFARGRGSRGYLAAFVPRGWFSTTLGGDPRRVAISEEGQAIEGQIDSVDASASFETLGRDWRVDVSREPPSGLQSTLPWLALAWPFAAAGIVFLIGRAITLRRRAQREVERIFEMSSDLIGIAGFDGRFRAVNPAFEHTLGYSRQETVGRSIFDFMHPDDKEASNEAFAAVVGGEELIQFEARLVCADGSARWLEWNARPAPEQQSVYGIARDVTERRRIDTELRKATRTAEARGAELRERAQEQAALRRVATLVAREAPQSDLFTAIAEEAGRLLRAEQIAMLRYESDSTAVVLAWTGPSPEAFPVGSVHPLGGRNLASRVFRSGHAERIDDYATASGEIAETIRSSGTRGAVAAPILVEGRLWGVLVAGTTQDEPLPPETEDRLGEFTDLVATAIANVEARTEVERLAQEQAALRRVATLVAHGSPPSDVLEAVAAEMRGVLDADGVTLSRYEPDDAVTVVAHAGSEEQRVPSGTKVSHRGENVTSLVRRTTRPARLEHREGARSAIAELSRDSAVRASVGAPIVVEGRLWGIAIANWRGTESPPAGTEERMAQFAELLDTAIANAESRDQLAASRARLITEADEARRRVVRDLHDGAQQRLVHTVVTLKLAQQALQEDDDGVEPLIGEALEQAERGNEELRELAHGILPSALTRGGVGAGVGAVVDRLDLPVEVDVPAERFPEEIEASAYFVVAEALTNVIKHSRAEHAQVKASVEDGTLHVEVRDDGVGGADTGGHGLVGMDDRVTALGGTLRVESPPGQGTVVYATLPLSERPSPRPAAAR
jgi:PAS domain S-box-containing protein